MDKIGKELDQYFAELTVTNPQQLLLAMLEIIKQRLAQMIIEQVNKAVDKPLGQFEEKLRKAFDIKDDDKRGAQ